VASDVGGSGRQLSVEDKLPEATVLADRDEKHSGDLDGERVADIGGREEALGVAHHVAVHEDTAADQQIALDERCEPVGNQLEGSFAGSGRCAPTTARCGRCGLVQCPPGQMIEVVAARSEQLTGPVAYVVSHAVVHVGVTWRAGRYSIDLQVPV